MLWRAVSRTMITPFALPHSLTKWNDYWLQPTWRTHAVYKLQALQIGPKSCENAVPDTCQIAADGNTGHLAERLAATKHCRLCATRHRLPADCAVHHKAAYKQKIICYTNNRLLLTAVPASICSAKVALYRCNVRTPFYLALSQRLHASSHIFGQCGSNFRLWTNMSLSTERNYVFEACLNVSSINNFKGLDGDIDVNDGKS